jgi:hypothetical protein
LNFLRREVGGIGGGAAQARDDEYRGEDLPEQVFLLSEFLII